MWCHSGFEPWNFKQNHIPLNNSFSFSLFPSLIPSYSCLPPSGTLSQQQRGRWWRQREAERGQVAGTAGSQRQQLCQHLASSPGAPGVPQAFVHPSALIAPEKHRIPERSGTGRQGNVCARVCACQLSGKPVCSCAGPTGQGGVALTC